MTSYAPPYALRVITVSLGTVASAYAKSSLAPWRMTPPCSCAVPGRCVHACVMVNDVCVCVSRVSCVCHVAPEDLRGAGEEARHVDEREHGDVERVGEAHEARRLDARVDVEAARQVRRVVA